MGSTFSITGPASPASVSAGQTATYSVNLTPAGGFNQQVSLSCAFGPPPPAGTSCAVSPSTITPNGTSPIVAKVSVATTAQTPTVYIRHLIPPAAWELWIWVAFVLSLLLSFSIGRRRRTDWALAMSLLLAALAFACGGGGGTSITSAPPATPAGTYNVTVTAVSGTLTAPGSLTVTVR